MEGKEYNLRLPLQEMVLRKIAIILCNRFCADSSYSLISKSEFLCMIEKEKVPLLSLPFSIEVKLMDLIAPILSEMRIWEGFPDLCLRLDFGKSWLEEICWTSEGTVNYRKTAKRLIKLDIVDKTSRYKLSCLFCFDDDIQKLWEELDECIKTSYYKDEAFDEIQYEDESWRIRRFNLITLWTNYLKGNIDFIINQYEDEPKRSFNQYAFESAALSGNKSATEYFLRKLTLEEREVSLLETVRRVIEKRCLEKNDLYKDFPLERFSDVAFYLLSQMGKTEQTQVFEKQSFATLICCLDWPWQDLFMSIAEQTWKFLSIEEYRGILTRLSSNYNYPIRNYSKIFLEFFQKSPNRYRYGLMNHPFDIGYDYYSNCLFPIQYKELQFLTMHWFGNLFETNKSDCIKLVLQNMTGIGKEKLIISKFGVELCLRMVKKNKWHFLEQILEDCALSKETKDSLKSSFLKCYFSEPKIDSKKLIPTVKKQKFLKLLDNCVSGSNKRHSEELEAKQLVSSKKKTLN